MSQVSRVRTSAARPISSGCPLGSERRTCALIKCAPARMYHLGAQPRRMAHCAAANGRPLSWSHSNSDSKSNSESERNSNSDSNSLPLHSVANRPTPRLARCPKLDDSEHERWESERPRNYICITMMTRPRVLRIRSRSRIRGHRAFRSATRDTPTKWTLRCALFAG